MLNILTDRLKLSTHEARMFALASIAPAPPDTRREYASIILKCSSEKVRLALEELMETQFKSPFIERYTKQGADGVLLAVLQARGFVVGQRVLALINSCLDTHQLELWAARAVTAATIDEVFA
jgi:hypothetical protein